MIRTRAALASAGAALAALLSGAVLAAQIRVDPQLLANLRSDSQLRVCGCIVAAAWLDESYPRVTVDSKKWQAMSEAARTSFSARALKIAETTYLEENAGTDQYEQIFIVNRSGRALFSFHPVVR